MNFGLPRNSNHSNPSPIGDNKNVAGNHQPRPYQQYSRKVEPLKAISHRERYGGNKQLVGSHWRIRTVGDRTLGPGDQLRRDTPAPTLALVTAANAPNVQYRIRNRGGERIVRSGFAAIEITDARKPAVVEIAGYSKLVKP